MDCKGSREGSYKLDLRTGNVYRLRRETIKKTTKGVRRRESGTADYICAYGRFLGGKANIAKYTCSVLPGNRHVGHPGVDLGLVRKRFCDMRIRRVFAGRMSPEEAGVYLTYQYGRDGSTLLTERYKALKAVLKECYMSREEYRGEKVDPQLVRIEVQNWISRKDPRRLAKVSLDPILEGKWRGLVAGCEARLAKSE